VASLGILYLGLANHFPQCNIADARRLVSVFEISPLR
jgi:hypothetical protein